MKKLFAPLAFCLALLFTSAAPAQDNAPPQPRVLVFFSLGVENDHMLFAIDALRFLAQQADLGPDVLANHALALLGHGMEPHA